MASGKELTITDTGTGGKIKGGNNTETGGGILNEGTLNIQGGTITSNFADTGGGIYNGGTLVLSGGNITGNTAALGGGVYTGGTLQMSGAPIGTGNTGGDVY